MTTNKIETSSFRDPSGFVYYKNGKVCRHIDKTYSDNYCLFIKSGIYKKLLEKKMIISHKKISNSEIEVEKVPFISYPYEWTFSQLKDAALLTLAIEKIALEYGMSLKDASNYNIQFLKGRPVLIDIFSFEKFSEKTPWVAYRQFCEHFFVPLLLASFVDIRLNNLLRFYLNGIPLDLASQLLPKKTYLNFSILSHIHFHAKNQKKFSDLHKPERNKKIRPDFSMNKQIRLALIDNLENAVGQLKLKEKLTEWGDYYSITNYSKSSFSEKKKIIKRYIEMAKPKIVWDLGGNIGEFSRIASDKKIFTVSFDIDPLAVEKSYLLVKEKKEEQLLPLMNDLANPTPRLGWANEERQSLIDRGPCDLAMALAIIHHLAISNNLPFKKIAEFFSKICNFLIIEFVPKNDSQIQKMLSVREDIFTEYSQKEFEKEFSKYFEIVAIDKIQGSLRSLYLMKGKK